jgi:hypothetical protein
LTNCFETDWGQCKVNKFIKSEVQMQEIKEYARRIYPSLRRGYRHMSYITENEVFCMSYNTFTDLVNQC